SCYGRDVHSRTTVSAIQFSGEDHSQPGSSGYFRALGRKGARGCPHSRICGEQRLLGSSGRGSHEGPHCRGAGPSWNWEVIEPWEEILLNPGVWHFNFHGPDAERLVAGRERIYFDRIWNDFTGDVSKPDEATRNFFAATYAQPGGMRAGFAQFTAFSQDAKDNKIFEQTKLPMPVLAVGGEKSFGALQAVIMRHVATNVQEAVVVGSGHWLMEERPTETVALIRNF